MMRIHHAGTTRFEDIRMQLRPVWHLALIHDEIVFVRILDREKGVY